MFVRDLVGSFTRPVKELKDFAKISLYPGEEKTVPFVLTSDRLRFYTKDKEFKAEPGAFNVWIGRNVEDALMGSFDLLPPQAKEEEVYE